MNVDKYIESLPKEIKKNLLKFLKDISEDVKNIPGWKEEKDIEVKMKNLFAIIVAVMLESIRDEKVMLDDQAIDDYSISYSVIIMKIIDMLGKGEL